MTVLLYEDRLRLLLDTAEGPVGRDLQFKTKLLEGLAQIEVSYILHTRGDLDTDSMVESEIQEFPLGGVVGAVGPGRLGRMLQDKAIKERGHSWIERALEGLKGLLGG